MKNGTILLSVIFSILLAIDPRNSKTIEIYTGLKAIQFQQILDAVTPNMLPSFKNTNSLKLALYIYLMKLRTSHTIAQIAPHFNKSKQTVCTWITKMRKLIFETVVPLHLSNRNRQELLNNTTPLSRKLYGVGDDVVVLTLDGTYVFTIKSSNFEFQKKSFSDQFKRNLVKFMMVVSTNGFIAAAYGPFEGQMNDANILDKILNVQDNIFQHLRAGDVVIVDRGFKTISAALRNRGFLVKSPKGTKKNKLSRNDANESRLTTKTRFVVEVRNSHVKNKWKSLNGTRCYQSIPKIKMDFQVGAALVNAFCRKIKCDKNDWRKIGDLMLSQKDKRNILTNIVHHIPISSFRLVNNLTLFPKLTYDKLKEISQGSYQIRLAKSYCHSHVKANENRFPINVCDDAKVWKKYFEKKITLGPDALLLRLNLRSRFQSNKKHLTYVLLDFCNGGYIVKAYCCSCRHGLRTVGCCGHVMTLIWYTLHIDHNKLKYPSSNLDHVFTDWQHSGVGLEILSEGDSELDSEGDAELESESNEDTERESDGEESESESSNEESDSSKSNEDVEFRSDSE